MSDRRSLKQAAKEINDQLFAATREEADLRTAWMEAEGRLARAVARLDTLQMAYDLVAPGPRGRKAAKTSAAPVSV